MNNILMNTDMTKAILDGRKTQTRRVIKFPHNNFRFDCMDEMQEALNEDSSAIFYNKTDDTYWHEKPKYQAGETIWVREPVQITDLSCAGDENRCEIEYKYKSDEDWERRVPEKMELPERLFTDIGNPPKWALNCQSIPNGCIKEMARIFLKVTDVRVERLQAISRKDCLTEGIIYYPDLGHNDPDSWNEPTERDVFKILWNSTAPKCYKWEDNPYVFVYEFERVEK